MAGIPLHITPLSYIRGTGTQYITTGFNLRSTDVVKTRWKFEGTAGNCYGCYSGPSASDNFCLYVSASGTDSYIRYNGQLVRDFKPAPFSICDIEHGPGGFYAYGSKVTDFNPSTFTCSAPLYIFLLANSVSPKVTAMFYGLTVYRDGEQLCNFIPARNELTGDVGVWESVAGQFYGNAGTGAFTAGPEVNFSVKTLLLKRRRALMGAAINPSILPAGYKRVMYLERASAGPWINTGFAPNQDDVRAIIDYECNVSGNHIFFGMAQYSGNDFTLNNYQTNTVYYWWGNNAGRFFNRGSETRSLVEIGPEVKLNGETVASLSIVKTFVGNTNKIALFGQANASNPTGVNYPATGKIYEFTIYYGDELKMHLIPCRDGNGVGYMYDTVSGQMLGNAGTGAFVVGPDI